MFIICEKNKPLCLCLNIKVMTIITIQDTLKIKKKSKFQTDIVRKSLLYKGPHDWFNLHADVKAPTLKQAFRHTCQCLKFTSSLSSYSHEYVFLCKYDKTD